MAEVAACTVRGLAKSYDGVPVFTDLDLDVPRGEVLAIVGPNGSGKTTLLQCVAGLVDITAGEVEIGGIRVDPVRDQPELRRKLAVATDEPALYEDMTPWQHARFVGGAWGVDDVEPLFAELLDGFDLTDRGDDQVGSLSRGMRQKVALALAFCHPADLYLVDEPFSGLDSRGREAFLSQLDRVCSAGGAAIVATHALGRVREFAASILDMAPHQAADLLAGRDEV